MRRFILISGLALVGCDGDVVLENARPAVTWVEVAPIDDETAALSLWVKDAEGDAVDVEVTWAAGGASGALVLAPASAPLKGLPTQLGLNTPQGQGHRVSWDIADVPEGEVTLSFTVDDRPFDDKPGDTYTVTLDPRTESGPLPATRVP